MGRTQHTYRMRLQSLSNRMMKYMPMSRMKYKDLWEIAHQLSGPASAVPYPDTHAIASFCMILEAITRLDELKSNFGD